jgi:hypothetical protein
MVRSFSASPRSKTFTIDDWKMDVFLFSGFDKDVIPKRAIAASGGDMPVEAFEMDDVGSEQGSLQPRISR